MLEKLINNYVKAFFTDVFRFVYRKKKPQKTQQESGELESPTGDLESPVD